MKKSYLPSLSSHVANEKLATMEVLMHLLSVSARPQGDHGQRMMSSCTLP